VTVKSPLWAVALVGLLALSGCAGSETPEVTVPDSSGPVVESEAGMEVAEDDEIGSILSATGVEDFLIDYQISDSVTTLWFVQINSEPSGPVALVITADPGGLHNFTAARAGDDWVDSPLSEVESAIEFTPGLVTTPGPEGPRYTWSNGPVTWVIDVDSQNRASVYRVESPEGTFVMEFSYGSDMYNTVPREFVNAVVAEFVNLGGEYIYGSTPDNFQTWDTYDPF
jgi:hypothetical protein